MRQRPDSLRVFMTIVGRKGGMDHIADLITENVQAHDDLNIQVTQLTTRGGGSIFSGFFTFASAVARFAIAGLLGSVDVLHINLAARGSAYRKIVLAQVARILNVPYVVHLHGGLFRDFWPSAGPHVGRAIDRLFLQSQKIIVLGHIWAEFIVERLPTARGKIITLPNATKAIAINHEQSTDAKVQITYLGILGPLKGTPQLIDALGQLAQHEHWTATLAGSGAVLDTQGRAKKRGIGHRVLLPGWLGPPEVDRLLRRTDILVLPSFVENLPMTILEGFAYGLAVVATPVGAVPEVIEHERNGLIVPVGDVTALAEALLRLIDDRALRLRLGAAARRDHSNHYDIEAYVPRLVAIWHEARKSQ